MGKVDYRAIGNAFSSIGGDTYRAIAAARFFMSVLYATAAQACLDTQQGGFPLVLDEVGDGLRISTGWFTPQVSILRTGERITVMPAMIDQDILAGRAHQETHPVALTPSEFEAKAEDLVKFVVDVIARQHAKRNLR